MGGEGVAPRCGYYLLVTDLISWLALAVALVSAGTAVWALVESYRSRPKPEFVFEWGTARPTEGIGPWVDLTITNQSEAAALDVRLDVDIAEADGVPWEGPKRLGPGEGITAQVPLYPCKRGWGARGEVYVPTSGAMPTLDKLTRPTVTVSWREEPNTRKIRRKAETPSDDVLSAGGAFGR